MKGLILSVSMLCAIGNFAGFGQNTESTENQELTNNEKNQIMKSYVSLFEIPANDLSRAIKFYEAILNIQIEKMAIPGMDMGIFPYEEQVVTGILVQGEGYEPGPTGPTIYLNAGDDLQIILDKVESNGGKIILPKTAHADESGFFALFIDSEGNKLGLNSPN